MQTDRHVDQKKNKNADLLKIAANFKVAANTGSAANVSVIDGSMVTDRSSKRLSPTKIPASPDGKIRVTTNIPIYRYDLGFKKDIGSERITKEFNDVWHFINWWKKATKNGTDTYYSGFKTEDGTLIDVDRINGYNMRSSRGLRMNAASTPEGRRMAGRISAAQQQGIITPLLAKRMLKRLRFAEMKFAQGQASGSAITDKYGQMVRNMDVQSKRLIEERAKQLGKTFKYYPDDPDTRSMTLIDLAMSEEDQKKKEDYRKLVAESVARDILTNEQIDRQFFTQEVIESVDMKPTDRLDKKSDPEDVYTDKVFRVVDAVLDQTYFFAEDRVDYDTKYFNGISPLDFYKNAEEETYLLIDKMIAEGDVSMSRQEAFFLFNMISGIVSQRSNNVDNNLAAARILYESERFRKMSGEFIDSFLIDSMVKDPDGVGKRFGFVNGMVAGDVVENLKKLEEELQRFKRPDGSLDHKEALNYFSSFEEGRKTVSQSLFGDKVGAFALNLNGIDYVDTYDSHVINNMKVYMGAHLDFNANLDKLDRNTGLTRRQKLENEVGEEASTR